MTSRNIEPFQEEINMLQRLPRSFPHALVVLSLFLQAWSFPPPLPAEQAAAPCEGILYDFDGSLQGWAAADYSDGFSTLTLNGEDEVPAGKGSVSLDVVLNRSRPSAEFLVDLFAEPPACAQGTRPGDMLWEPGSVLSAWVWAPEGSEASHRARRWPSVATQRRLSSRRSSSRPLR